MTEQIEKRDTAAESVERQAVAFQEVERLEAELYKARNELRLAENGRLRPTEPLTVIIDGKAITSSRVGPNEFHYVVSRVI